MGWREVGKGFSFVAAGQTAAADASLGSLFGIDTNGALFVHSGRDSDGSWTPIAAEKLKRVAVGRSEHGGAEIWALREDGKPIASELTPSPNWRSINVLLAEIAVGPIGVWGLTEAGGVVKFRRAKDEPFDGAWVEVEGTLAQIAVGEDALFATEPSDKVLMGAPQQDRVDWKGIRGVLRQITAAGKIICATNRLGDVFYRVKDGAWFSVFDDQHLRFEMCCTDGNSIYALDSGGICWGWTNKRQ